MEQGWCCRTSVLALVLSAWCGSSSGRPTWKTRWVWDTSTSDCVSWNNGTNLGRAPFAHYTQTIECSGAWDPECTWRVLAALVNSSRGDSTTIPIGMVCRMRPSASDGEQTLTTPDIWTSIAIMTTRRCSDDNDDDGIPNGVEEAVMLTTMACRTRWTRTRMTMVSRTQWRVTPTLDENGTPDYLDNSVNPCGGFVDIGEMEEACAGTMPYVPNEDCAAGLASRWCYMRSDRLPRRSMHVDRAAVQLFVVMQGVATRMVEAAGWRARRALTVVVRAVVRGSSYTPGSCISMFTYTYECVCYDGWGGRQCAYLVPIDCMGAWGNWSDCNADCGGGFEMQYTVAVAAAHGGVDCPRCRTAKT